jgi:hypothetical protein
MTHFEPEATAILPAIGVIELATSGIASIGAAFADHSLTPETGRSAHPSSAVGG